MYEWTTQRIAKLVGIGAAALLLVDLFLDWHRAAVFVAGAVNIDATSAGWSGWGIVAGVLAVVVIALLIRPETSAAWRAAAGLALFAVTAEAALGGKAHVSVADVTTVDYTVLWSAWVGMALAAITAVATLVALVAESPAWPRIAMPHGHA